MVGNVGWVKTPLTPPFLLPISLPFLSFPFLGLSVSSFLKWDTLALACALIAMNQITGEKWFCRRQTDSKRVICESQLQDWLIGVTGGERWGEALVFTGEMVTWPLSVWSYIPKMWDVIISRSGAVEEVHEEVEEVPERRRFAGVFWWKEQTSLGSTH